MTDVTNNEAQSRYELTLEGTTAIADYTREGDRITFTHTLVPRKIDGEGVGTTLITAALDDARERGLTVVPQCPFVAHVIEENPAYQSLT